MSFRVQRAMFAVVVLAVATTVATSQTPQPANPGEITETTAYPSKSLTDSVRGQAAAAGKTTSRVGAAGDMIGFSHSDDSGTQTITLVDAGKMWMAVYHIDRSGKIRLVSSRPLDADFSLEFNATEPLPEEIRRLGGR